MEADYRNCVGLVRGGTFCGRGRRGSFFVWFGRDGRHLGAPSTRRSSAEVRWKGG